MPPLSLMDIRLFVNNINEFWKPLFIGLFFTGVRISEAAGVKRKMTVLTER